jgi:gliding motility-associated-like protein
MNYFKYFIFVIFFGLPFWAQSQCLGVRLTVVAGDSCFGNATILARDTTYLSSRDTYRLFLDNNLLFTRLDSGYFRNLTVGRYRLQVTNPNCSVDTSFTIRDMSTLGVHGYQTAATCLGINNGTARVVTTNGTSLPTFRWNTGATTNSIQNLAPGLYSVSVYEGGTCHKTASVTVGVLSDSTIRITSVATPAYCSNNGAVTIAAQNGIAPYQFRIITDPFLETTNNIGVFRNLGIGYYSILVQATNGCYNMSSFIIKDSMLLANIISQKAYCGQNNGVIQTQATKGLPPYRYILNRSGGRDTNSTGTFRHVAAGNYTVTIVDSAGCSLVKPITVNDHSFSIAIRTNVLPATCRLNGGQIRVSATDSFSTNYIYKLIAIPSNTVLDSNATGIFTGLRAGSYNVLVISNLGCSGMQAVTILDASVVLNYTTVVDSATCLGSNGRIQLTLNNGQPPYTYRYILNGRTYDSIANPLILNNLRGGEYVITMTDSNTCTKTIRVTVPIRTLILRDSSVVDSASCAASNGRIWLKTLNGRPPYTYHYDLNGQTYDSIINPLIINNLAVGNYEITITDADTCAKTIRVTVPPSSTRLRVQTTPIDPDCYNATGQMTIVATNGTAPYQYRLRLDTLSRSNHIGIFTNLNVGRYWVQVVDSNGCDTTFWAEVRSKGMLSATADTVSAICTSNTGRVTVTGAGGTNPYTYHLNARNESNQTGRFENLASGTYVIRVMDSAARCSTNLTVNIGNIGRVTAAVQRNVISCIQDSVQMRFLDVSSYSDSVGALTRQWIFSNGATDTTRIVNTLFGTQTGHIQLIINSNLGCVDTFRQTFPIGLLSLNVQDTVVGCPNTTVAVTARANSLVMPLTYNWQPTNGNLTDSVSRIRIDTIRRVIYVSVTNGICTKRDSIESLPLLRGTGDTISIQYHCENGLKLDFRNPNPTLYRLSYGDTAQPNAGSDLANSQYEYIQSGHYRVRLIPKVACLDTLERIVRVQTGAIVKAIADFQQGISFCTVGDTLKFGANSIFTNYIWSSQPNLNPVLSNDRSLQVTAGNRSQTYYVSVQNGNLRCTDSTRVVDRRLGIAMQDTIYFCENLDNQLVAKAVNPTDGIDSVFWQVSNGVRLVNGQGTLTATLRADRSSYVYGFFRNQWGCTKQDSAKVVLIRINATLTTLDTLVTKGAQAHLTANVTNTNGSEPYRYAWNPSVIGSGNVVDCVINDSTLITVTVTESQNSCKALSSVMVRVKRCDEPEIYIPTGFSPNNDGHNDAFQVENADKYLETMRLSVFDRWGNAVFQTTDLNGKWDGMYDGMPVAPGVYGYFFIGTCKGKEAITKKGNVTVLK